MEKENDKENSDTQSKINARRELRRRKILDNAKNRMDMLSGKGFGDQFANSEQAKKPDEPEQYSDPEVEPNPLSTDDFTSEYARNYENIFASPANNVGSTERKQNVLLQSKAHLLLAVIIGYLCAFYLNAGQYTIFLPAGTCILLDTICFWQNRQVNPLLNVLSTFIGIHQQRTNQIYNVLCIFKKLIVDLSVVVFFVCISCYILQSVSDQFTYLAQFK